MATILNDDSIRKLFGTVITQANEDCLRPNSYVLRLGKFGEFLTSDKAFEIGEKSKRGIIIPPGHSVGITALEDIDFSRETVHQIFPDHDLHAILSPTTDLSREGIVAQTTQVDAGYRGTLNWTIANTSGRDAKFVYGEKIYRMTIFKLAKGETPDKIYAGDYQDQHGYIGSQRKGPPAGMKSAQWVHATDEGGPEDMLNQLIKSGYPWNALGSRLKHIDNELKTVTEEYARIGESIMELNNQTKSENIRRIVREEIREQASAMQNRWLIGSGALLMALGGIAGGIVSNEFLVDLFKEYGGIISLVLLAVAAVVFFLIKEKKPE